MRTLFVIALALLLAGCDGLGLPSENERIRYDFSPERPVFTIEDTIRANLINRSERTLYVLPRTCLDERLEKSVQGSWKRVYLGVVCAPLTRRAMPVAPDSGHPASLRPWMLESPEIETGTYRLVLDIGRTEEEATTRAVSDTFQIVVE